jgi:hypothetical protein
MAHPRRAELAFMIVVYSHCLDMAAVEVAWLFTKMKAGREEA